jgi:DnaK suppressor protein
MAAKKPAAKATKAKKTVAKKAEPAKKAVAPAKKSAASAHGKSSAAKPAAKPSPKAVAAPVKTPSPAKAPTQAKAAPTPVEPAAAKASPKSTAAPTPRSAPPTPRSMTPSHTLDIDSAAEGDEGESPEAPSTNLLAGPRNVKPYIARRGEQYMGKEQLEHFRNILNTWKRDLMHEVDRTVLHMKDEAANFPDPNDRATQESEFSLELRTRDRERKLIRKIDEAIKRIEDGSYGYCVETGEEIGIKRLEARPVATLCLEAQERRERREKQYGDRDDRYR